MNEWFTAQDLAKVHGVTVARVHWLAHRHRWRRLGTRPQRYLLLDIRDSGAKFRKRNS